MVLLSVTGRIAALSAQDGQFFFNRPGWETDFTLQPWRIDQGQIDARRLRLILGNLDRVTANGFLEISSIGSLVRLRIESAPDPEILYPELFAIAFDGPASDPELAEFVVPAQTFTPFEHTRFGTFVKQDEASNYQVQTQFNGRDVTLALDCSSEDLSQAASQAEAMFDRAQLWQANLGDCIYRDLYSLWRDVWRESQPVAARDVWLSRISMTHLTINASGGFLAHFDDGDLFWGHSIETSGSLAVGSVKAGIIG